jgi:hypothetical protein
VVLTLVLVYRSDIWNAQDIISRGSQLLSNDVRIFVPKACIQDWAHHVLAQYNVPFVAVK